MINIDEGLIVEEEETYSPTLPCVVIESPYAGDVERNTAYARACLKDSLSRGEAPIASHLLYTQVLDDKKPEEREAGISAGLAWLSKADLHVFYIDLGMSQGMKQAEIASKAKGFDIQYRKIPGWEAMIPLSMERFSLSDDIMFNPESFFSEITLKQMEPYHIFTGAAIRVEIEVPHQYDCEYCNHTEKLFLKGKTEKELRKEFARLKKTEGLDDEFEDYIVEHVFFAKVVRQEKSELEIVV